MASSLTTNASPKKDSPKKSLLKTEVFNMADLAQQGKDIEISQDTLGLGWKVNSSPGTIDGVDLKKPLCKPLVKKIDLVFQTGLQVTARNTKGVTIRDALDAIHKPLKNKAEDEMDLPYLKGFEWDKESSPEIFVVHFQKESAPVGRKGKKG